VNPEPQPEFGVVYVAFGPPYLAMALTSVLSLRATNPDIPVCLVTNVTDQLPAVPWWNPTRGDVWQYLERPTGDNRLVKTDIYHCSPFAKTLFLDCDTFVLGSLDRIRIFLNYFDLVLRFQNQPCRVNPTQPVLPERILFRDIPHFNGGVLGFRKNQVTEGFFQTWAEQFVRMGIGRDQPPLMEACFLSQARMLPLREEWNHRDFWNRGPAYRRNIVIWHYKPGIWDSRLEGLIQSAVVWFRGTEAEAQEVAQFIKGRNAHQNRRDLLWRVKRIGRELFGALSKVPEQRVGKAKWRELVGGGPRSGGVP